MQLTSVTLGHDTPTMRWSEFLDVREQRLRSARAAAQSIGDADPRTWLPGWCLDDASARVVHRVMMAREVRPLPAEVGATLADASCLPPGPPEATQQVYRRHCVEHGPLVACTLENARAWALAELDWLGGEVAARERGAWRDMVWASDAGLDARSAALWSAWFSGDPWAGRAGWDQLYLPVVVQVFRGVLHARRVPSEVQARTVSDLREAFFFALLGGERDGDRVPFPGWADLAARVVETTGNGPVAALAGLLGDTARDRLAHCAAARGHWADTLASLYPDRPDRLARAAAVSRRLAGEPDAFEVLLDTEVVLRLIEHWQAGAHTSPVAAWDVVVQNRGRTRARLRAVAGEHAQPALWRQMLAVDGLHARTVSAVSRFAWSWAWRQLAHDFAFDDDRGASRRCDHAVALAPIVDGAPVRAWVLLVTLRGRLGHLRRWVRDGSTGDHDTTWGRLLADEVPDSARDPGLATQRAATYQRLRAWLSDHLADEVEALQPLLLRVAALAARRSLPQQIEAITAEAWHGEVRFPKSGFPTMLDHARATVRDLGGGAP